MSWGVSPWVYPVWDSLGFLDLGGYFLPHFGEIISYYLLEYFLMAFLFVFFFWDSYDSNVGAFHIVPEVPEVALISFDSFFFFPLERVTGRKARGLQMEERGCKCQTFLSLLSSRRKQTSNIFSSLYKFKRRFLLKCCVVMTPGLT